MNMIPTKTDCEPQGKDNAARNARLAPQRRRARGAFSTLGRQILFWMAVMALGPLLVTALLGYRCARQAIIETEEAHLRALLEAKKGQAQAWFNERRADLEFLASAVGSAAEEKSAIPTWLREHSPFYDRLTVSDGQGNPIVAVRGGSADGAEPQPGEFMDVLRGSNGFSAPELGPDGQGRVRLSHRIEDAQGHEIGYVGAEVNLSPLFDSLFKDWPVLGKTGHICIASGEGRRLFESPNCEGPAGQAPGLRSEMVTEKDPRIFEYTGRRGQPVLGAAIRVPELPWMIVAEVDKDEAFAWLRVLRVQGWLTGAATLVLALLIATQISGRLARPLRELATVSRRIAQGRHQERLGPMAAAEAQEVAIAFNLMLDQLAESHRRLVQAASLAAVGQLSSSVVHETRNPLTTVKMNLQALRAKVGDDAPHRELAEIALTQVARLEKMLTDLLNYGKPIQLNLAPVKFAEAARDTVQLVSKAAEEKAVSIDIEDALGERRFVADPELVRRILTNLASNAVEAVPRGGKVAIAARLTGDGQEQVVISVSDSGPGIPPAYKEKIFQPFFTSRADGTGLGLANVKKLTEYHGGTATGENRPEGGALFTVRLPLGGPAP